MVKLQDEPQPKFQTPASTDPAPVAGEIAGLFKLLRPISRLFLKARRGCKIPV
ncbi:hypothetical protein FRC11_001757, partial [Ceratobasidium sp. 423]